MQREIDNKPARLFFNLGKEMAVIDFNDFSSYPLTNMIGFHNASLVNVSLSPLTMR